MKVQIDKDPEVNSKISQFNSTEAEVEEYNKINPEEPVEFI